MKSYKELIVWQKSMDLTSAVYKISLDFPKEEKFGLTQQIRRCILSVPSNIAEGFGRHYSKEFLRFLLIARGSLYEFQTQIYLVESMGFLRKDITDKIDQNSNEIEKLLNGLIKKIRVKIK